MDGALDQKHDHPNTLTGWISGDAARFMETLSDEIVIQDLCHFIESLMQKYKNNPQWKLPKLSRYFVTRWYANPQFRGAYSYRNQECDLRGITNECLSLPIYVGGYPRILFAGEATHHNHGTVHGAMSAAQREVDRLEAFWKNNMNQ